VSDAEWQAFFDSPGLRILTRWRRCKAAPYQNKARRTPMLSGFVYFDSYQRFSGKRLMVFLVLIQDGERGCLSARVCRTRKCLRQQRYRAWGHIPRHRC
jgi:hypothetical protein